MVGYAICSIERSGSTLLSDLLQSTGVAGRPLVEPFNQRVRTTAESKNNLPDLEAYLSFVCDRARSANGILGINLMWRHLALFGDEVRTLPRWRDETSLQMLQHFIPELDQFVLTYRRDRLAQAVSWAIAYQTDRWRHSDPQLGRTPRYEFALVDTLFQSVVADSLGWETLFKLHGIEPLRIAYEDLSVDGEEAVRQTLVYLGLPATSAAKAQTQLERQANKVNQEWCDLYRADVARMLATPYPKQWLHN